MFHNIIDIIRSSTPLFIRTKVGPSLAWINYIFRLYFISNKLTILSINSTLEKIIKEDLSFVRFGDGEMSIIENHDLGFQTKNSHLSERLKEVLQSDTERLLICVPSIFGSMRLFNKKTFWFNLHHLFKYGHKWLKYLDSSKVYGDAFISRPYLIYKDKSHCDEYFKKFFSLWYGKNIAIIEGDKTRLGVGNNMFKDALSVSRILCPSENAFDVYQKIKDGALKISKETLVLVSLGPTAKVLTYDLFKIGYRAIDIGHIDMEYEMFLRNSEAIVKVEYKYFNEIGARNPEDCKDPIYLSQIIARIE